MPLATGQIPTINTLEGDWRWVHTVSFSPTGLALISQEGQARARYAR